MTVHISIGRTRRVHVWHNGVGWCAGCPCCNQSLAFNQRSWAAAHHIALRHAAVYHPAR